MDGLNNCRSKYSKVLSTAEASGSRSEAAVGKMRSSGISDSEIKLSEKDSPETVRESFRSLANHRRNCWWFRRKWQWKSCRVIGIAKAVSQKDSSMLGRDFYGERVGECIARYVQWNCRESEGSLGRKYGFHGPTRKVKVTRVEMKLLE